MSRSTFALLAAWLCLGVAALAHHSVGINFDSTKAFNLTGVLSRSSTSAIHIRRSRFQ